MAERWLFEQDEECEWTWTHSGLDEEVQSSTSFDERIDCLLDAVRYAVRRRRSISDESPED